MLEDSAEIKRSGTAWLTPATQARSPVPHRASVGAGLPDLHSRRHVRHGGRELPWDDGVRQGKVVVAGGVGGG